jgi:hypothetical protein
MTAFHIMILSEFGDPLIPTGGSLASRLKSRMRRRLAAVDYGVSGSRGGEGVGKKVGRYDEVWDEWAPILVGFLWAAGCVG